jgi:predicted RNA-binding protein with PUA-like domain
MFFASCQKLEAPASTGCPFLAFRLTSSHISTGRKLTANHFNETKQARDLRGKMVQFKLLAWGAYMPSDYLLKTEPTVYSFADLKKDGVTIWDGVSNPTAVKNLREMEPGARLVIYETGEHKSAVGTATVVSVDASNPKNPEVKIKVGKAISPPVSLAQIKTNKLFADSPLVRIGRLSVVPLTKAQYAALAGS